MNTQPRPSTHWDADDGPQLCGICGVPYAVNLMVENEDGKLVCPKDADEETRTELGRRISARWP